VGEKRNAIKFCWGRGGTGGKGTVLITREWEVNIKKNLTELEWGGVDWIYYSS
jgi:hypothetical protein